jgi:hypothetical protein
MVDQKIAPTLYRGLTIEQRSPSKLDTNPALLPYSLITEYGVTTGDVKVFWITSVDTSFEGLRCSIVSPLYSVGAIFWSAIHRITASDYAFIKAILIGYTTF